jgi:hypothetical protein
MKLLLLLSFFLIPLSFVCLSTPNNPQPGVPKVTVKDVTPGSGFLSNSPPTPADFASDTSGSSSLWDSAEFSLSIAVLSFGLLVILIEMFLINGRLISETAAVRFIVVTLIITASLFLMTAGYGDTQIAPAFGLFGTVAGYVLGKSNEPTPENKPPQEIKTKTS